MQLFSLKKSLFLFISNSSLEQYVITLNYLQYNTNNKLTYSTFKDIQSYAVSI